MSIDLLIIILGEAGLELLSSDGYSMIDKPHTPSNCEWEKMKSGPVTSSFVGPKPKLAPLWLANPLANPESIQSSIDCNRNASGRVFLNLSSVIKTKLMNFLIYRFDNTLEHHHWMNMTTQRIRNFIYLHIFSWTNFFVCHPNMVLFILKIFLWMKVTDLNMFHRYIYWNERDR